jgi:thioredoxin-related protein
MKYNRSSGIAAALFIFLFLSAASPAKELRPASARSILDSSLRTARKSGKNVMLIYHASWCRWCARLDSVLALSPVKEILDKYFVIALLDVREKGEKIRSLENPGAYKMLKKFGGEASGLPFIVFVDRNGKMTANSNIMPDNQNVGYPSADDEISAFVKLLKKVEYRLTEEEAAAVTEHFKKYAVKEGEQH